jgi:Polyketide cyclase / dehydrase and lipid transport
VQILKKIGIGLAALIAALILVSFLFPRKFGVSRSIVIQAPVEIVFDQVNDLRKWNEFSPWLADDPNMELSYGAITVGEGASYSWKSESAGSGTMTSVEVAPNQLVRYKLDFDSEGGGEAVWKFAPAADGVTATWEFSGDAGYNPINRWFGLFIDTLLGPYYEKGLAALKDRAEKIAADSAR